MEFNDDQRALSEEEIEWYVHQIAMEEFQEFFEQIQTRDTGLKRTSPITSSVYRFRAPHVLAKKIPGPVPAGDFIQADLASITSILEEDEVNGESIAATVVLEAVNSQREIYNTAPLCHQVPVKVTPYCIEVKSPKNMGKHTLSNLDRYAVNCQKEYWERARFIRNALWNVFFYGAMLYAVAIATTAVRNRDAELEGARQPKSTTPVDQPEVLSR